MLARPLVVLLALATFGCAGTGDHASELRTGELLSRRAHDDYEACTYSFEHGVRDDPERAVTRNDWDLEFGNGGDVFSVTMVVDDCSRIVDLGRSTWDALEFEESDLPIPHLEPAREPPVEVRDGHVYVVRTLDRDSDLTTLVRVESLVPGDRVEFTWRRLYRR